MRDTLLEIDLPAIRHNAGEVKRVLAPGVKMMSVVKADAYGHGSLEVASALDDVSDAYAVAIAEEGIYLRDSGIEKEILVLGGGNEASLRASVKKRLSMAVYEPEALRVLEDEACRAGEYALAHLKVDTGMSRIGVRSDEEVERVLSVWKECPHVKMTGMFTHFCVADTDAQFTKMQYERFAAVRRMVNSAGFFPYAHAAASTALENPLYQLDMVRAGIVLYGTGVESFEGRLRYAQFLRTRPLRIDSIDTGDTVGYGRTFTAARPTRIMTLPIGYGDGYPRILSGRADVLVRGCRAPIVGRVCMDMMMVDVTDVPDISMQDEVVLLGAQGNEHITPDELADKAQTIPYEIMLGFSSRITRTFK